MVVDVGNVSLQVEIVVGSGDSFIAYPPIPVPMSFIEVAVTFIEVTFVRSPSSIVKEPIVGPAVSQKTYAVLSGLSGDDQLPDLSATCNDIFIHWLSAETVKSLSFKKSVSGCVVEIPVKVPLSSPVLQGVSVIRISNGCV